MTADPVGDPIDPGVVRVRVGDDVAYDDGRYGDAFAASDGYVDEWSDGLETGDVLELTNGGDLPEGRRVFVEVEHDFEDDYVVQGRTRTP